MTETPDLPDRPERRVGYGRPPEHSRFKKGYSGNPNGRPKKAKAPAPTLGSEMLDIFERELARKVRAKQGDEEIVLPARTVIVRKILASAMSGDARAQGLLLSIMSQIDVERESQKRRAHVSNFNSLDSNEASRVYQDLMRRTSAASTRWGKKR